MHAFKVVHHDMGFDNITGQKVVFCEAKCMYQMNNYSQFA